MVLLGVFKLEKGAKTQGRRELVGFVGRLEFHDGRVFAFHAKPGDALAAVDVKRPQRGAQRPGDAGQEAGKRAGVLIIGQKEAVGRVEAGRIIHQGRLLSSRMGR